mmetsp:Transcript_27332/g.80687  ORF Transcript_27332/g.80687 Transcript_27332/m.80687 type:complete len:302 (-) Transcript_27332:113-1018(-)
MLLFTIILTVAPSDPPAPTQQLRSDPPAVAPLSCRTPPPPCRAAAASDHLSAKTFSPQRGQGLTLDLRLAAVAITWIAAIVAVQTTTPSCMVWLADARAAYPQLAGTASAFGIYAASDALSQVVTHRGGVDLRRRSGAADSGMGQESRLRGGSDSAPATLDVRRMLRSASCSALLSGWFAVHYFRALDSLVRLPGWAAAAPGAAGVLYACLPALGKVLFDIAVYEPVYDAVYLSLQGLLRGERLAPRELLSAVLAVWRRAPYYWAPADIINFSLVSTRLRPLYNAVASIPWSMHLSQSANA